MSQKRSAFLFGANGPEGANLKPLQYAQNDIRHIKTAFSSSFCNFHYIADYIADTSHVLLTQLERFAYTCGRPDLLVVHFSGHGFVWNGQLYLLCNTTDVDSKLFNSTAISIAQIKTILDQCSAKHKLLILDCCFAGIAQGVGAWKSEEQLPGLESLKGSVNAILAACPAHRPTRELDALELYQEKGAGFLSWAIACACDGQFTQVAREDALSLSDILDWLPDQRDNINKSLSQEDRIPAPRIINQRDLVGDDEIWFTSRRRSNLYHEVVVEKKQREEHALFQHVPFLQQPCPTARPEDFDANRVHEYAQHDGDVASLLLEDLPRLCQQLGLTSTIGTPTRAAVLAFHKAPGRHLHSALIRTTCYVADERDRYLKEDIEGPLGEQVEHAFHWLLDNLRTISEHVDAGERVDRCEIPEKALRELIANAVVHRDYEANETTQIKITPRQVTITNPGRLNAAIMNHEPPFAYRDTHPHNPLLLKVLITERWAEGRARGFEVVMEEFRKHDLVLPEIKNLPGNLVQVTIQRPEFEAISQQEKVSYEALPYAVDSTPLAVWNVPYLRNPHFTGRDELLERLAQQLSPEAYDDLEATRRVALTQPQALKGLGGVGKTQVAVEYAYRSRDLNRYTHTFWVDAASEEVLLASFVALAELLPAFPEKGETDQRKLVEAIKRWLKECSQRWLLIFDNADDIALVRDYFPKRGNGSILLTTRASAIGSVAESIVLETMSLIEGTHLLLRRARRFAQASDEEIDQAGNIVATLDYFPLALDQAGAYIEETGCSFVDYLEVYQNHRQALLARRGTPVTDYPYSVATTWSLSLQKVQQANPAAAEFLQLCAFLAPDHIPEELIKEGVAYWPPLLQQAAVDLFTFDQMMAELLKFSLVKRLVEDRTLSIHRLVQAVQMDMIEPEVQHQWAESVVRAVNKIFPGEPNDVTTWPQCIRYCDQAQACSILIEHYSLLLSEGADLLNRTGFFLDKLALYTLAEPLYQRALATREQQLRLEHSNTALSLNNLAELYRNQGKYTEAEPLYLRSLALFEQVDATHPNTATSLNNLALLYNAREKYGEAEPLYLRALAIWEQQGEGMSLNTASCLNNLANLYYAQEKYTEAEPLYLRALVIWEQERGTTHPDMALSFNNLAELYRVQGKYTEAEALYQRALAISEKSFEGVHPNVALILNNLALLYHLQGKYEDAEPLYQRALAIFEQKRGDVHPNTASCLSNLANLYYVQKKYEDAEPLLKRALSSYEQIGGATHPYTQNLRQGYVSFLRAMGRDEEAKRSEEAP